MDSCENELPENVKRFLLTIERGGLHADLATSFEGMYGENTLGSLRLLFGKLGESFGLTTTSIFLDIGSGRGVPVLAASLFFKVSHSIGVEMDRTLYYLSLSILRELYEVQLVSQLNIALNPVEEDSPQTAQLVSRTGAAGDYCTDSGNAPPHVSGHFANSDESSMSHVSNGPKGQRLGSRERRQSMGFMEERRIAFLQMDGTRFQCLSPVTHLYSFDLAMHPDMIRHFSELFNKSKTAKVYVSFRPNLVQAFGLRAVLADKLQMTMSGSREKHTAYIYTKLSGHCVTASPFFDDLINSSRSNTSALQPSLRAAAKVSVREETSFTSKLGARALFDGLWNKSRIEVHRPYSLVSTRVCRPDLMSRLVYTSAQRTLWSDICYLDQTLLRWRSAKLGRQRDARASPKKKSWRQGPSVQKYRNRPPRRCVICQFVPEATLPLHFPGCARFYPSSHAFPFVRTGVGWVPQRRYAVPNELWALGSENCNVCNIYSARGACSMSEDSNNSYKNSEC